MVRAAVGLAGLAGLAGAGLVGACAPAAGRDRITVATGAPQGVYRRLGDALAGIWHTEIGVATSVLASEGSVDNVGMLGDGRADVAFCAADVAADGGRSGAPLRAIARVHDDAVHVVVPAGSPARRLADLRGRRVSVGAPNSGVIVIVPRLLATVGLVPGRDLVPVPLGLAESAAALRDGTIDAFFWSGGLPTAGVEALARVLPIRLLDLTEQTDPVRRAFPVYEVATIPARTYGLPDPVATVSVRNLLLVRADLDDATAAALTSSLLDRRAALVAADPAGRSVDPRTAIGTQPVALHPGAAAAYRRLKGL